MLAIPVKNSLFNLNFYCNYCCNRGSSKFSLFNYFCAMLFYGLLHHKRTLIIELNAFFLSQYILLHIIAPKISQSLFFLYWKTTLCVQEKKKLWMAYLDTFMSAVLDLQLYVAKLFLDCWASWMIYMKVALKNTEICEFFIRVTVLKFFHSPSICSWRCDHSVIQLYLSLNHVGPAQ